MIIPASIFRISGFINKETNKIEDIPQAGGLVLCYSESGKPVILELLSNKKETTLEDINTYFDNKLNSVMKDKEVIAVASELSYLEDFEIALEKAVEEFKENNSNDRKAIIEFKKAYTTEKAREIVIERRRLKKGSIIKTVIDIKNNLAFDTYKFGNSNIPIIRSRSLIFDTNGIVTTTGFYYYSQTANSLPITIIPIFKKEGEALNFFKVQLSKLANLEHFNFLIEHIERSINKQIKENTSIYLPGINYDYDKIKDNKELMKLIKNIRTLSQEKEISQDKANIFKIYLKELKEEVNKNPKLIIYINLVFNLIIGSSDMKALTKEYSSPLTNLNKSFVNLNFSKENPDIKNKLSKKIESYLTELIKGDIVCEISATYHTPALKYGEESDSWGFMLNNVQAEAFVLSFNDIVKIYNSLEELSQELK